MKRQSSKGQMSVEYILLYTAVVSVIIVVLVNSTAIRDRIGGVITGVTVMIGELLARP